MEKLNNCEHLNCFHLFPTRTQTTIITEHIHENVRLVCIKKSVIILVVIPQPWRKRATFPFKNTQFKVFSLWNSSSAEASSRDEINQQAHFFCSENFIRNNLRNINEAQNFFSRSIRQIPAIISWDVFQFLLRWYPIKQFFKIASRSMKWWREAKRVQITLEISFSCSKFISRVVIT